MPCFVYLRWTVPRLCETDLWIGLSAPHIIHCTCGHALMHIRHFHPLLWHANPLIPCSVSLSLGSEPASPSSLCSVHTEPEASLKQAARKCAAMRPCLPLRWVAPSLWGGAALRQLRWQQSQAGGLSRTTSSHHLSGKSRADEEGRRSGHWRADVCRCLLVPPRSLSGAPGAPHAHTHTYTLSPLAYPFFPSAAVCDAGVLNSRILLPGLHGGAGRGREPR